MPRKKIAGGPEDCFAIALRARVAALLAEHQAKNPDLTNASLANLLGVSVARVTHLKREQCDASAYFLTKLAAEVGISLEELITGEKIVIESKPSGMIDTTEAIHLLFERQNLVRAAVTKLAESMGIEFEKHALQLEKKISQQDFSSFRTGAPNEISRAEIVELERNATMVYICSRDLPYLSYQTDVNNDFITVESDGISRSRKYRYLVGGVAEADQESTKLTFMNTLKEKVSEELRESFEHSYKARVEVLFYGEKHRPVFSWALHNVNSMKNVRPDLAMKYGNYFHEILGPRDVTQTWIGHLSMSLPEQKLFFLMPKDLLERSFTYFNCEYEKLKKVEDKKKKKQVVSGQN